MIEIAPCPNPECDGRLPGTNKTGEPSASTNIHCTMSYVFCPSCQMSGPSIKGRGVKGEAAAIAAWNSISMGWRKPEKAPKDGSMIQATMRTAMLVHALWVKGPSDPGEGEGPGWFCPESGVEYWESDLLGWRSIPPLPEGE